MSRVPEELFPPGHLTPQQVAQEPGGLRWLDALPELIERARSSWELRLDAPFRSGSCSWTAPAWPPDGTAAVLKISWPHREERAEARALRQWDGDGAVRLLAQDAARHTLLLERCLPGTELRSHHELPAEERLLAGCAVLRRLWRAGRMREPDPARAPDGAGSAVGLLCAGGPTPGSQAGVPGDERAEAVADERGWEPARTSRPKPAAGDRTDSGAAAAGESADLSAVAAESPDEEQPVERLVDVAAEWAELVEERGARAGAAGDPGLFAHGARLLWELPRSALEHTLLHGDFNPGNLLAATRSPWLALDAKPLVGDPAYDPWPLLTQIDDPYAARRPVAVLRARTALAAEALGLDVARLRAWMLTRQVEELLWSWERQPSRDRDEKLRRARVLATVAEV